MGCICSTDTAGIGRRPRRMALRMVSCIPMGHARSACLIPISEMLPLILEISLNVLTGVILH